MIKEVLKVLLKDIGIPSITLEDMEFTARDNCYWISFREGGKALPTIIGFTEYDGIGVEYTDEGNYIYVDSDTDSVRRFVRDISEEGLSFELDISLEIMEKLIQGGIKFSIVEDYNKEKFCITPGPEVKVVAVGDKGFRLKFQDSSIWVSISESSKIRIYL